MEPRVIDDAVFIDPHNNRESAEVSHCIDFSLPLSLRSFTLQKSGLSLRLRLPCVHQRLIVILIVAETSSTSCQPNSLLSVNQVDFTRKIRKLPAYLRSRNITRIGSRVAIYIVDSALYRGVLGIIQLWKRSKNHSPRCDSIFLLHFLKYIYRKFRRIRGMAPR